MASQEPQLDSIIDDLCSLLQDAAHPRHGTLSLSPETAALLESLAAGGGELAALAEEVSACRKCGLCEGRTQTVFSDGSPHADLVFVG